MRIKPWKRVEIGDQGWNYGEWMGIVVGKGKGKKGWEKLKKWDESGAMSDFASNLDLYGYTEEQLEEMEMVAIRGEDGNTAVYSYGVDGFYVEESIYESNLEKVLE